MSTTRKIAHNTLIQIIGKVVSTLLGLFAIGILTRYLGTEQFGWYTTAISFLQFVGILIDFGMTPVSAQMLSEVDTNKQQRLFQNLLGFRFVSAIIFLGIAPLVALAFPYPPQVKIAIAFMSISFLAIAMNQVFVGFYQKHLAMHLQVMGEFINRVALVVGLWLFISYGAGFLPLMGIVTLASVTYMVALWLFATKLARPTFAFDWPIWKSIMIKMWPIAISIIFNVVYLRGDLLILSIYFSQSAVGIYGAAYRVIDILTQTAMMLMGVILPLLTYSWSRKLTQKFSQQFQQAFDGMMLFALPMTVGTMVLSEKIMVLVAGPEFAASGAPLRILALTVFAVYISAIYGHTAVAINKQKQTMWVYMSCAVITLTLYLTLIPRLGMAAAAWLTVFSEIYVAIFLTLTVSKYIEHRLQLKTFWKVVIATAIMGVAIYYVQALPVLLVVLIGALIYAVVLFGMKAVSKETIREVLSIKN